MRYATGYRNHMVSHVDSDSGVDAAYAYDALGRRIQHVVDDGGPETTRYFYSEWRVTEEQDENNATAWGLLSGVYLLEGNLAKAHKAAEKAAKLAPDNYEAQVALGRILLAQNRPKAARSVLELALKQGKQRGSWEALFLLGRAMVLTENGPEARQCRHLIDNRPGNDNPLHARLRVEQSRALDVVVTPPDGGKSCREHPIPGSAFCD